MDMFEKHPLESLYNARDALQQATTALTQCSPPEVCSELGSYGMANTALVEEFKQLVASLERHVQAESDSSSYLADAAHKFGELRDAADHLSYVAGTHQSAIADFYKSHTASFDAE